MTTPHYRLDSTTITLPSSQSIHAIIVGGYPEDASYSESLALANATFAECSYEPRTSPIEDTISLLREQLEFTPVVSIKNPLSSALLTKCLLTYQLSDFVDALQLQSEVFKEVHVLNCDYGHMNNETCTSMSAKQEQATLKLSVDFLQSVDTFKLDKCIDLYRDFISSQDTHDLRCCVALHSLGSALKIRFLCTGHTSDLDQSISIYRQFVDIIPDCVRFFPLLGLSAALLMRWTISSEAGFLRDAASLVAQISQARSDRSTLLDRAKEHLKECDKPDQLEKAITCYETAALFLPFRQPSRPSLFTDLANILSLRFGDNNELSDLEAAVKLYHDALKHYSTVHPSHANISGNLAKTLLQMFRTTSMPKHLNSAMDAFRVAVNCNQARLSSRYNIAREWAQSAHTYHHSSALEGYREAIDLLPYFSLLGNGTFTSRRSTMASVTASGLACSAASCAIAAGHLDDAVEMLEGRAIFWDQALQLRTPLDALLCRSPVLGERFKDIMKKLEECSLYSESSRKQGVSAEQQTSYFYKLYSDYLATLREIRSLEHFHNFLMPKSISELRIIAANGPVVILTAAVEAGCDALIVTVEKVIHVPLSTISPLEIDSLRSWLQITLTPNGARAASVDHLSTTLQDVGKDPQDTSNERKAKRVPRAGQSTEEKLQFILSVLWIHVVRPIFRFLQLKKSKSPPRLWWCATGQFSFLPIHAAGMYRQQDDELECTSDYIVSSYTHTLSALLPSDAYSKGSFKMVVAAQSEIPNKPNLGLPHAHEEVRKIQARVPANGLVVLGATDDPTSINSVLRHLTDASIVHFACHGRQSSDPLKSSLLLGDGDLEVSHIVNHSMPNALLAVLSACETAMGDKDLPDEFIHIASTMLFAGFRGVVATLWSIQDQDAPKISDVFYEHLFRGIKSENGSKSGNIPIPDVTQAARALHHAIDTLRSQGSCPLQNWVPFIHMGI